jgi:hypothetical protein
LDQFTVGVLARIRPPALEVVDNVMRSRVLPENATQLAETPRSLENVVKATVEEDDAVFATPFKIPPEMLQIIELSENFGVK